MNLALKLRLTYGSLVNTYVDLCTIWADAPIEIRALAQEDRLQILKTLEAQAAPDAVVSESPDVQIPQNKRQMSEPALHTPVLHTPVCRILKISCRCLSRLLIRQMRRILKMSCRCLSRLLTLPLNVTVSLEVLRWKGPKGCSMQIGVSALAPEKSVHMPIAVMYSFVSST